MKKILGVFLLVLFFAGFANAAPITIQFSGEVTFVGYQYNAIHIGDIFTGTYTYDTEATNTSTNTNIGKYGYNSPYGISITLGEYEFKTDITQMSGLFGINIGNDVISNGTTDYYYVHSDKNAYTNGLWIGGISWELRDNTYNALSSIDLPVTAPVLTAWNYNNLFIYGGNSGTGYVNFGINGKVTQIIPEPLISVLLITGMFFLRSKQ